MKLIQKIIAFVRHANVPQCWLGLVAGLLLPVSAFCASAGYEQTAKQILDRAGIQGGLIVHLGCGDGKLTAALHANDSYIVQGLDADVTAAGQTSGRLAFTARCQRSRGRATACHTWTIW